MERVDAHGSNGRLRCSTVTELLRAVAEGC